MIYTCFSILRPYLVFLVCLLCLSDGVVTSHDFRPIFHGHKKQLLEVPWSIDFFRQTLEKPCYLKEPNSIRIQKQYNILIFLNKVQLKAVIAFFLCFLTFFVSFRCFSYKYKKYKKIIIFLFL